MSILDESRYRPVETFMGLPLTLDLTFSKAAILGLPFDCGTHPVRVGSRLGPAAIRTQSALLRPYDPPFNDFNPFEELNVVDCGNAPVVPGVIEESYRAIEEAVWGIVSAGVIPVTLGGDGAVTLPQLRALHRKYQDLVVLHFDAHTDAYAGDGVDGERYNTATTFTRAAEEGLLDVRNSFHIGARGPVYQQGVFEHTRSLGYELIPGDDLFARDGLDIISEVRRRLVVRPVYLCFDMDFFDPSCAPGVCAPAWGGPSAREGLTLMRRLRGLQFVAFDVNTLSPPHDVGGMTALLAAVSVHQFLYLACEACTTCSAAPAGVNDLQLSTERIAATSGLS